MASRLQDVIQRGLAAARPLATAVAPGTLYFSTDTSITTRSDGTTWQSYGPTAFGTGDVVGPGIAVNNDFALFSGVTGKLIQDSGIGPTLSVGTPGVDTLIPTEKAIRTAIAAAIAALVPSGMTLIQRIVTASSAASIDFTSIPATFENLMLIVYGRLSASVGEGILACKVNNDGTAGNYPTAMSQFNINGVGPTRNEVAGSASGGAIGAFIGSSTTSAAFSMIKVMIPGYARTLFNKGWLWESMDYGRPSQITGYWLGQGTWLSAAAINRLTITGTSTFADGTAASLYGMI